MCFSGDQNTALPPRPVDNCAGSRRHNAQVPSVNTGGSGRSTSSAISNASIDSVESIRRLRRLPSIISLLNTDLNNQRRLLEEFSDWVDTLVQEDYATDRPWTREVFNAYTGYKAKCKAKKAAKSQFDNYYSRVAMKGREEFTTPEEYYQCVQYAITWAQTALEAVSGRTSFLLQFRTAYANVASVQSHVTTARDEYNSGMNAIQLARSESEKIFKQHVKRYGFKDHMRATQGGRREISHRFH